MTDLRSALRAAGEALARAGARWALVGGLAVSSRAEPRFTRDIDLAVAVDDDAAAERVVASLLASGYQLLATLEQTTTGRLATVRLRAPGAGAEGIVIDLLFASSGLEREIVDEADAIELFEGILAPVASVRHLVALKVLARDDARRPQDIADLQALLEGASPSTIAGARAALTEIEARGFARGRDLQALLTDVLASR